MNPFDDQCFAISQFNPVVCDVTLLWAIFKRFYILESNDD